MKKMKRIISAALTLALAAGCLQAAPALRPEHLRFVRRRLVFRWSANASQSAYSAARPPMRWPWTRWTYSR